jgi:peptidoglycan/LPS O-acetylase OafA/YrhL
VTRPYNPGGRPTSGASAPVSVSPLPNLHGHLPVLDGVRGLAVLMVLLFHFIGQMQPTNSVEHTIVAVTKYGGLGVELFFILSGFLITGILYDARNDPHYFRNFYMRRVLRIFPLYFGVLALVFFAAPLIPLLRGPTLDYLADRQAWAWLYGVNIYLAKHGEWSFSYLNHFWSLSVEEHFYLVWPLVVFLLARRPGALIALSLATSLGAMLGRLVGLLIGLSWSTTVVLTPFQMDGLALGAFLAVTVRQPGGLGWLVRALPRAVIIVSGLLMVTYIWTRLVSRQELELVGTVRAPLLLILLACLLVWTLIAPKQSAISRFFRSRSMVFLGTYSYGLYVYHHFISYYLTTNRTELELARWLGSHGAAVTLQATLGASASLAVAYLSYELFEKRFLRLKRLFQTGQEADASSIEAGCTQSFKGAPLGTAPGSSAIIGIFGSTPKTYSDRH